MDHKNILKSDKNYIKVLVVSTIIILIMLMIPREQSFLSSYQVGEITREPIIAPYDFDVLRSQSKIDKERKEAIKNVPAVFDKNNAHPPIQEKNISNFFDLTLSLRKINNNLTLNKRKKEQYKYSPEKLQKINKEIETSSIAFEKIIKKFKDQYVIDITNSPFNELYKPTDNKKIDLETIKNELITATSFLYKSGIVDIPKDSIKSIQIAISESGEEKILQKEIIYDRTGSIEIASQKIYLKFNDFSHNKKQLISQLSKLFIDPNLIYNKERTEKRQQDVLSRIPLVDEKILKNEKIVDANTRITKDIFRKLYSLNKAESVKHTNSTGVKYFISFVGDFIIIIIIYSLFIIFLFNYRKNILKNNKLFILIALCQVIVILFGFLITKIPFITIVFFPMIISAMLVTIFFDERTAIFSSIIILFLMSFVFGNHFKFLIIHLLPTIIAIITVRNLRNRDQIFRPIGWVSLGYIITVSGSYFVSLYSYFDLFTEIAFAFGNVLLSVLITYGLVNLFEKIFDITTDITLLELSDLTHPILKELSLKAPGTFNHSITVGMLAESAAEEVNANNLLARVGAYYHDIGKIPKAEYFIENQNDGKNKLDQLKPRMAAKVIINHVKTGLEMAQKYKLPQKIKDFISTHHGTMTVAYFYNKAQNNEDSKEIDESDFKYNGPKPFTKETGIIMIVEAIEAAVRSLKNPTHLDIENICNKIIQKRLNENELENCPLTFADLTKIKKAILPKLNSMYHKRIAYPDDKENKSTKDEESESTNQHS
ncbi:MAG: HDIG domain-containing protein [Candidatus Marinimicrobia bacterium]|jgi:putative nucleotidyltransferase with HDIG domain|nr:HDIG domain-containing protein [Candidatus Neomarinimicrobiota bacterium]